MLRFIVLAIMLQTTGVVADSPLTSTKFYNAYTELEIVAKASGTDGMLTSELTDYLVGPHEVDVKIAVVNALGASINGRNNAQKLQNRLSRKYSGKSLPKVADADELISLAYLKAMDNYFNVEGAVPIAAKAADKAPESFSVQLIYALIKAQKAMDTDWCKTYKIVKRVKDSGQLNKDMRPAAVKIVFNYMNGYADYCK